MIREFFAPRLFLVFLILWAISWSALMIYIKARRTERERFIRRTTAPFISGAVTLVLVIAGLAFLTVFN